MSRRLLQVAALCLLTALLCGCVRNRIREDTPQENYPPVNPSTGIARSEEFTLYFQLTNTRLLAAVTRTMAVNTTDNTMKLVLNALIAGPGEEETTVSSILPPGTKVLRTALDGTLAQVTFSKEILNTAHFSGTAEEIAHLQRLGVYAVVNSLCSLQNPAIEQVELLVDKTNSGVGIPIPPSALGFSGEGLPADELGPLSYNSLSDATPQGIAEYALDYLVAGNFEKAYTLFASGTAGSGKPSLSEFANRFYMHYRVLGYTLGEIVSNPNAPDELLLSLHWMTADGEEFFIEETPVVLRAEENIHRLDYYSLLQAMQQGQQRFVS